MKYYLLVGLFLLCNWCSAQNDTINPLPVAEEMPRFPGCEIYPDLEEKNTCSQKELLRFIYQYIAYPDSAVTNQIEGSVVIQFVVTKAGHVTRGKILKDIGYGCGDEALRVINLMSDGAVEWIPAKHEGDTVDVLYTVPIRFKLEDPVPYVIVERDTVWTEYQQAPSFIGGETALQKYIDDNLNYPASGLDSCEVGVIACDLLIRKNGQVLVMNTYNYAGLSQDFEFEAIRVAVRSVGQWTIAQLDSSNVAALYPVRFIFKPTGGACSDKIKAFDEATLVAEAGMTFYNEGNEEAALAKWEAAINLFPQSVEYRYWRGQAYLKNNQLEEACIDFTEVKKVMGTSGYDNILPLICR